MIKEVYIRLKRFHNLNYLNSWQVNKNNIIYGQKIISMQNICIYVPGGNTIYPSSIFMNAIPANIYKPKFLCLLTPIKNGLISNLLLSISYICKINELILSGGVHTLACVVYGTKTIKKVNKISGPGNFLITKSKKIFFGNVGIDMLAGPSESMIICDDKIHPKIILYDFLSQLEHDKNSKSILISNNFLYLKNIYKKIYVTIKLNKNKKNIFYSLKNSYLVFNNFFNAINLANFVASEHLLLCVKNPLIFIKFIKNCGTILINYFSSISYGDYIIGPSHVIPTNKSAKFFSSLNIQDFCKKICLIINNNVNYCKLFASYFSNIEKFLFHFKSSNLRL